MCLIHLVYLGTTFMIIVWEIVMMNFSLFWTQICESVPNQRESLLQCLGLVVEHLHGALLWRCIHPRKQLRLLYCFSFISSNHLNIFISRSFFYENTQGICRYCKFKCRRLYGRNWAQQFLKTAAVFNMGIAIDHTATEDVLFWFLVIVRHAFWFHSRLFEVKFLTVLHKK